MTLVGVPAPTDTLPIPAIALLAEERRLLGCLYGSARVRRDFPRFVGLAESGMLDLATMVTRVVGLDAVNDAMADLQTGTQVRSVVMPSAR
jgi:S-(hydroxymethyl)glutathione dehydrogenase / alcohol dehydrogenase